MSKISLELWAWTFGCWIFTATVLPSCSTALWTWASDAAPRGVSSKLTKSSFICQEKTKRHQLGVPETILRKALPTGQRQSVPKLGRLNPFILSLSPAWAFHSSASQWRLPSMEVPWRCSAYGNLWQIPSSTFHLGHGVARQHVREPFRLSWKWVGAIIVSILGCYWVQKPTTVPLHVFLLQIFNTTHHHPLNLTVRTPLHYSSIS